MSDDDRDDQEDVLVGEVVDEADDLVGSIGSNYERSVDNPVYRNLVEFAYAGSMLADRPNAFAVMTLFDPDSGEQALINADPQKAKRIDAYFAAEQARKTGGSMHRVEVEMPTAEVFQEKVLPKIRAAASRRTSRPRLNSTTSTATKRRTSRPPR